MTSPNKQNSMTFRTEIGLKWIIRAKCFTCKGIVQYLRHKTKQYCHKKTFICLVLLCARSAVYESFTKIPGISGLNSEKWVGLYNIARLLLLSIHLVKANILSK